MKPETKLPVIIPCNLKSFERERKSYIYIETALHLHKHKIVPCGSPYHFVLSHCSISAYLFKFQKSLRHTETTDLDRELFCWCCLKTFIARLPLEMLKVTP